MSATELADQYIDIAQDALQQAMSLYSETNGLILKATHTVFAASLRLEKGLQWTCFIIRHTPMVSLRGIR